MDQWVDRQIKESGIIGGNTKNVYEIAPTAVIQGDQVYKNMGGSPWGTSNVMAKVAGITKTNTSVFPEKRGEGYCARLDTRMESVKVLGLVNITVLAESLIPFLSFINYNPIVSKQNPSFLLPIELSGHHIYIYSFYILSYRRHIFQYLHALRQIRE